MIAPEWIEKKPTMTKSHCKSIFFDKSILVLIFLLLSFSSSSANAKAMCWIITDDLPRIYRAELDVSSPKAPILLNTSRIYDGEGIAYRASTHELYTWSGDRTYVLNPDTGADIRDFFYADASSVEGAEFYINPTTKAEELWVIIEEWNAANGGLRNIRYLKQIDIANGAEISSVALSGGFIELNEDYGRDTGGLAIDPNNKAFWVSDDSAIDNGNGTYTYIRQFSEITNTVTGTLGAPIVINEAGWANSEQMDLEAFSFADDGNLYGESDDVGHTPKDRYIWKINADGTRQKATLKFGQGGRDGSGTSVDGEIEGIACNAGASAVKVNITGSVYRDNNSNDSNDSEPPIPNIAVTLYRDTNNNGAVDSGDTLMETQDTDASGNYSLAAGLGNYIVRVDAGDSDLPAGATIGTPNPLDV
ncbi:MAG: hypothetical protein KAH22_09450, partial [Thiotrichaceae bacterium]|nr:hypothetical protein [Thiotrichaceae bacterium]